MVVKNFERVSKRSWSQIIDLVETMKTVQESSKSELSSGGRRPFKVFNDKYVSEGRGGGFPQKIIWNNSSNVKDIKILWPEPIEFEILGLKSIGYKDKVIFPLIVDIEDNQKQTNLNLNINYLVCKDVCIPGNADIFLNIPSGDGEYKDYFFEIEKVLSTTLNNNIDFTPISNFSFKAIENNNSVIFDIEISTSSFFDDPHPIWTTCCRTNKQLFP